MLVVLDVRAKTELVIKEKSVAVEWVRVDAPNAGNARIVLVL